MYPTDPDVFLLVRRQEHATFTRDAEHRRVARARARLVRDELRVQRAWEELTAALAESAQSRQSLADLVHSSR
ncbi:hypothetical protein HQ325_07390 [Rhodococcus sp. BP-349]|uniref:hypothetical protein n=1 Tax=unclassified Rhodococcus (in: high G+C Gram-positive bacteria) TaxID=192944 RepID=UPI001C9AEB99|nr:MULTISPECIES: hypothetical protein [unclassified Rhodococcus (in: high G+C Gram-positive bacteria)]MBY6538487.1 hypothetical protein [Rhodococcus sp. BP-363]MBY6542824.1 hypothetical protein [Rhodococcus sp. BP-369]MBY6562054.1 hypothetical protein [Rhodococcus sp. BP-370]MBY6576346.1 hypothetical protein [Rhodococcus sp. BP-364]MBY6585647.1 hypothetical protein [Rhodococcus sp. BP-358]